MVRSATQFPMLPWFNHDFFFFFFFLQVRFLTSLFFFCEISHPKISPWETLGGVKSGGVGEKPQNSAGARAPT